MSEQGDVIDRANHQAELADTAALEEVRLAVSRIPAGSPGTCDLCGAWSGRLVRGVCAPCRDKFKLP